QKNVHRDEDDEHAVPAGCDPVILNGDRKKQQHQSAVVGRSRLEQRDVLFHGPEAEKAEKPDRKAAAESDGREKQRGHDPPGADARAKLGEVSLRMNATQQEDGGAGQHQQCEDKERRASHRSEWCEHRQARSVTRTRFQQVMSVSPAAMPKIQAHHAMARGTNTVTNASAPAMNARSLLPMGPS